MDLKFITLYDTLARGMSQKDRILHDEGFFRKFSQKTFEIVDSPTSFIIALILLLLWAISGLTNTVEEIEVAEEKNLTEEE
ncbi:MAG: hypothetical protein CVU39_27680 [Chloroflexi bacterium HGW-Chloroflexi-10]|nr:MAG: hypothetical protein CVU39_27680 [Chloroflexi bacterium HGW-Chloroflexi-10]